MNLLKEIADRRRVRIALFLVLGARRWLANG
jgi:hypothetical protein